MGAVGRYDGKVLEIAAVCWRKRERNSDFRDWSTVVMIDGGEPVHMNGDDEDAIMSRATSHVLDQLKEDLEDDYEMAERFDGASEVVIKIIRLDKAPPNYKAALEKCKREYRAQAKAREAKAKKKTLKAVSP